MAASKKESKYETGQCGACGQTRPREKGDYQCFDCRGISDPVQERLEAAEEVCWTLLMMMALGGLEIDQEWKDYLHRSYQVWADKAVETGIMATEEEDDATRTTPQGKEDKEAEADSEA